jgi:putative aldouronate transport system permease protein
MPKFYQSPGVWPLILTLANQWKYMGYNSIVYTAAISGIDSELYEAATLDGASTWGKIRHITLPMLKPMMIILTIMAMGRMANADFGLFYNLPMGSGPLLRATEVFDTYVYRMLTNNTTNMGITAAGSLFQSVLGFVLIFTSNMVVRKVSPDNSLF